MTTWAAFAPASVGNVGVGFDSLGAAVAPLDGELWGDVVVVSAADSHTLRCVGPHAASLPEDPHANLAWIALQVFERHAGCSLPPLAMTLEKRLPVASGLGSSASSAVAALVALDALAGKPLDTEQLLAAAGEVEAHASDALHLDNVAPILLGGLRLIDLEDRALALPFPEDLLFVVVSPELRLETRAARRVLPATVPLELAVAHGRNLASFVHALHVDDRELLADCLCDLLAEPHRADLVPGFREVQAAALEAGALGCTLSGAGPAIFAIADARRAPEVATAAADAWRALDVGCAARVCRLDRAGARLLD